VRPTLRAMKAITALSLAMACPALAHAARPLVTDDARLTTPGSCQLEAWTRQTPHSTEWWAMPACNPWGSVEITAGGGIARPDGLPRTHDTILQLKTLWREVEPNGWGVGLAIGTVQHPSIHPGPNQLGNHYAYIPISVSFDDDQLVVHANVGHLRDRASKQRSTTWGLGGEARLHDRVHGVAEVFGDHRTRPYIQAGVRWSLLPDRIQIDATTGRQVNGPHDSRWFSLGIRVTPRELF